ncbi:Hypothetical protein Cul05146_0990 [Corynebacterium ulcerans]|uniref:Transposase n=1 Tax=Corynebacterium ulcerans FRC58 TaxID=1408268 RepID=A0ABM5U166_CORUL|nr:Hypothetical protein Cul05146_0990 [Corynebacterium ulcerans]AKN76860.1 Hypothetical protein CulFRC58_1006 [Corynebacterium ulcerans FRC58]
MSKPINCAMLLMLQAEMFVRCERLVGEGVDTLLRRGVAVRDSFS